MEDEHDVEGIELLAGDGEGQADEDGVEDDAEFEDEDCRHLSRVVLPRLILVVLGIMVFSRVAEMVVPGCVPMPLVLRRSASVGEIMVAFGVFLFVGVSEGGEAHGHEFGEEEGEDGHEHDAFHPAVLRDDAC